VNDASVSTYNTTLYLTFDDGPLKGSEKVNVIAAFDSIKINVFIIGKFVFKNDSTRQFFKAYQDNPFIEIGNHSFTHANSHYHSYYQHPEEVMSDFFLNNDTLHLINKITRLPGRNCWRINGISRNDVEDEKAAADSLVSYKYKVFGWDIEWHSDSEGKMIETATDIFDKIEIIAGRKTSLTPNNIVILCHDPMLVDPYNESELRLFIKEVKASGNYQFEHLSNYPR
jgi:peptidoglycan/xylan/chitin deacetylase (PgdA/CDA1 family)